MYVILLNIITGLTCKNERTTMFERIKKIVLLCSFTVGIYLFPTALAYAQKINVEVLNADQWIDKYGGKIAENNRKVLEGTHVYCGNQEQNLCDVKTQVCLKCTYFKKAMRSFGARQHQITRTIGACVPKASAEAAKQQTDGLLTLFRQYNQECPSQEDEDKGYEGSGWLGIGYIVSRERVEKGDVVIEPAGFVGTTIDKQKTYVGLTDQDGTKETWDAFHGKDGKLYSMAKIGGTVTIVMGESNAFNGCEVLPVKIYNMQACFFCPLANLIFTAANKVTTNAFRYFGSAFRIVISMVFCIWLALAALGQVFPMTKQDAPKFLAGILKQGFKFMVAFFLLYYGNDLFRYFIVPLLDSGLTMGVEIQTVSLPTPENYTASKSLTDAGSGYYNLSVNGGRTLYERIEEYLASLQARLAYVQAIGTTIFCVGSHKISLWDLIKHIDDFKAGLRMMFLGGVLTSFSFLLTMAFAFYFMDALLQLAVIGAMIPFMIAGWPFKATAQYASTGFKMLLNTFFAMFFTGFVISANVELINQSLALSQENNMKKIEKSAELDEANEETKSGFETITKAINDQDWTALNDATDIGGTGFLLLAFCCIFGFKFVGQVTPLASSLSAGVFRNGIATKIGTMAASTVKGMATKAAAPVAKVAGNAALGAVGTAGQAVGNAAGAAVGGTAKLAGKGLSAVGNTVSKHGGVVGKAAGGALKGVGWTANKAGSMANSLGKGAGRIAKGAADGMKK